MLKVLFVCTGNTCRSPMAKALYNAKAKQHGYPTCAQSAGLAAADGMPASKLAIESLSELSVDLSSHRSKRITAQMLWQFDLIVCMSRSHMAALEPFAPKDALCCLPQDIPDPFAGTRQDYDECRNLLSAQIDELLSELSHRICPMTADDVPSVASLEAQCFGNAAWSERSISEKLAADCAHLFVCRFFDETAGYIAADIIVDECYISNLAVAEKHRGKGVGTRLLSRAEQNAAERGCKMISLEVREHNEAAVGLYRAHGFIECGRRKGYYTDPDEDALIMTKQLGNADTEAENENSCN